MIQDKIVSAAPARGRAARAGARRLGPGRRGRRGQPPRAHRGRLQRRHDPRLEPRRARRSPGDDAAGAPARRVGDRDARRLRLPSRHDGLRHVRLLRRLPGAAAPRRARGDAAATASSSRAPAATSCRVSPSPTTRSEAERMGTRIAVAALESVADRLRDAGRARAPRRGLGDADLEVPPRAARGRARPSSPRSAETVTIPLMPHPPLEEISRLREQYDRELERGARDGGRSAR